MAPRQGPLSVTEAQPEPLGRYVMLNLTNQVRAPLYNFEVFMVRSRSLNAVENSRKRMAYVKASNADDAKREAKKIHPQFHPESARRV